MTRKIRVRNARLAYAMAQAGMNNTRLSKVCSLHPVTVSALLNQRRDPTPETARKIAHAVHCKVADLFPEVTQ